MNALELTRQGPRDRLGLKGARAAEWLAATGIPVPGTPNTWTSLQHPAAADALLVARLGASEFFLEERPGGTTLKGIAPSLDERWPGVYPVLREDSAFRLDGEGVHEVLAQVCNVNFAALALDARPLIMTLMIGVAVLIVPQTGDGDFDERRYCIWCDPTFGAYLGESLGAVVVQCGGTYTGVRG